MLDFEFEKGQRLVIRGEDWIVMRKIFNPRNAPIKNCNYYSFNQNGIEKPNTFYSQKYINEIAFGKQLKMEMK